MEDVMDHDQNFKNLILDYPREALKFFAREESEAIGPDVHVLPVRQEQLKERLGERFRELDVPLLVEWPDGRREALLFVLEEESDPRRFSIHRLAHYCLDLAQLLKTERVVPVVIFLHGGAYPRELNLGGDRHNYLNFRYLICDLSTIPFEQYRESDNIVARLNLPNMKYAAKSRIEVYAQAVRGLLSLESSWERQSKYIDFIDIYAKLDHNELELYRNQYPEEANKMTSFAERFREEGVQQGMQQGRQEGREQGIQQGEVAVLLRQMERKFGHHLTDVDRQLVASADTETLLRWSDRILSANSIEEILH
jgi:hypothetical protein